MNKENLGDDRNLHKRITFLEKYTQKFNDAMEEIKNQARIATMNEMKSMLNDPGTSSAKSLLYVNHFMYDETNGMINDINDSNEVLRMFAANKENDYDAKHVASLCNYFKFADVRGQMVFLSGLCKEVLNIENYQSTMFGNQDLVAAAKDTQKIIDKYSVSIRRHLVLIVLSKFAIKVVNALLATLSITVAMPYIFMKTVLAGIMHAASVLKSSVVYKFALLADSYARSDYKPMAKNDGTDHSSNFLCDSIDAYEKAIEDAGKFLSGLAGNTDVLDNDLAGTEIAFDRNSASEKLSRLFTRMQPEALMNEIMCDMKSLADHISSFFHRVHSDNSIGNKVSMVGIGMYGEAEFNSDVTINDFRIRLLRIQHGSGDLNGEETDLISQYEKDIFKYIDDTSVNYGQVPVINISRLNEPSDNLMRVVREYDTLVEDIFKSKESEAENDSDDQSELSI